MALRCRAPWHGATRQPGWLAARVPLAIGVSQHQFSSTGTETLMIASYGYYRVDNTVTAVVARRVFHCFQNAAMT